jgi:hypothetical protein
MEGAAMRMQISAEHGVAVVTDGDETLLIRDEDEEPARTIRRADVTMMFQFASDVELIEVADIEAARLTLRQRVDTSKASRLFRILTDEEALKTSRRTAAAELENHLRNESVLRALENELYSQPLPARVNLRDALKFSERTAERLRKMLGQLQKAQTRIRKVRMAWDTVAGSLCRSVQERLALERIAAEVGFLHGLVTSFSNSEAVDRERQRHMLGEGAKDVAIWADAVERTCDELLHPVPGGHILIVDRDSQRVRLLKEILNELRVNVDEAVRVVDHYPDPNQCVERYDLIIRDALLGDAETKLLPQIGWQRAQEMLTGRGRVASCFPNPSYQYTLRFNEVRLRGDRRDITEGLRTCLRHINRPGSGEGDASGFANWPSS